MWLCSRNDAIGNVAVMVAAVLVAWLNNGAPDLIVAGVMAALFLTSSYQILKQSWGEWREVEAHEHHEHEHEGNEH